MNQLTNITNRININVLRAYGKEMLAIIIFLIAYFPTLIWMWDRWFIADSYYTHGILVPVVTVYLIWQMRHELRKIRRVESVWGFRLILLGIIIHLFSAAFRIYFSSGFSMMIVLIGLILHFYGEEIFKKISFPIAFLIFMIPLPQVVIANASFKLKLFAAEIATMILNNMGIDAIREGSIIKMRHAYAIVDDVCSGLRSLISLTALGSIFAFWMRGPMNKRILLFVSTIPIAIVTNVCRVVLLSAVSEIWGTKYATGIIHDVTGFMVFGLAFILLFAMGKLIE